MRLKKEEYSIGMFPMEGGLAEGICISRNALGRLHTHYISMAEDYVGMGDLDIGNIYYAKAQLVWDIITHFHDEAI